MASHAGGKGVSGAVERLRRQFNLRQSEAPEFYEALAKQVVEQRRARGLSQWELAQLCATTQSAIARLERGARPPRMDTLLRVAWALDCNLVIQLKPRTNTQKEGDT